MPHAGSIKAGRYSVQFQNTSNSRAYSVGGDYLQAAQRVESHSVSQQIVNNSFVMPEVFWVNRAKQFYEKGRN